MIILLSGPPFNRTDEQIGWMTRQNIQKKFLSHRGPDGILIVDALLAEERAKEAPPFIDPDEGWRAMRRMQAMPEYLIERELAARKAAGPAPRRGRKPPDAATTIRPGSRGEEAPGPRAAGGAGSGRV